MSHDDIQTAYKWHTSTFEEYHKKRSKLFMALFKAGLLIVVASFVNLLQSIYNWPKWTMVILGLLCIAGTIAIWMIMFFIEDNAYELIKAVREQLNNGSEAFNGLEKLMLRHIFRKVNLINVLGFMLSIHAVCITILAFRTTGTGIIVKIFLGFTLLETILATFLSFIVICRTLTMYRTFTKMLNGTNIP